MSGTVVTLGAHVLDILGRYVTHIPEGQGSVLLDEIRLAPAGSAAGTAVGLAKLGLEVATAGAVGDDALGDVLIRALNGFGVDTSARRSQARRPNLGQHPADSDPTATGPRFMRSEPTPSIRSTTYRGH